MKEGALFRGICGGKMLLKSKFHMENETSVFLVMEEERKGDSLKRLFFFNIFIHFHKYNKNNTCAFSVYHHYGIPSCAG